MKAAHKNGKAGLMIRADQSSGSPYFSVGMTFENGLYVQSRNETVITSYSIHYTKLYEFIVFVGVSV